MFLLKDLHSFKTINLTPYMCLVLYKVMGMNGKQDSVLYSDAGDRGKKVEE